MDFNAMNWNKLKGYYLLDKDEINILLLYLSSKSYYNEAVLTG